uniref:G domain-containing protein n=1 Tax=Neogobius melanostomus TaxID=47308 RepID=A0A8C6SSR2_9GOBI
MYVMILVFREKDEYLNDMKEFKPGKEEVEHIRVTLYGAEGSGKSSFINTIESALRGRITGQALTDGIGQDSFTKKVKTECGSYYPFVFTDLMGMEKQKGITVKDIELVLKGHVEEGYKFDPETGISRDNKFYNSSPTINNKTHVLVFVVSASTIDLLHEDVITKMRSVRIAASDLGIPQLAILTKIDVACTEVQSDLNNVYKSKMIKEKVDRLHALLGLSPNVIFPVKNYHTEIMPEEEIDKLALMALKQILNYGKDYVHSRI